MPKQQLASEKVVIAAPMSFAGSAGRIWKLTYKSDSGGVKAALIALALLLIAVAWFVVLGWYLTWGLFLVPYRLIRRGSRKRRMEGLRHREMMAAMTTGVADPNAAPVPEPQPQIVASRDEIKVVERADQQALPSVPEG